MEIQRLSTAMPELKLEHFEYFIQQIGAIKKTDADNRLMIDSIVNRVIVYPDKLAILINVLDKTNTPPLQQINAALAGCLYNDSIGGRNETQYELFFISPHVFALLIPMKTAR